MSRRKRKAEIVPAERPHHWMIGPNGPRVAQTSLPGDIYVSGDLRCIGRVVEPIRFGEINTWGQKIMPLNPHEWSPAELAMAHSTDPPMQLRPKMKVLRDDHAAEIQRQWDEMHLQALGIGPLDPRRRNPFDSKKGA